MAKKITLVVDIDEDGKIKVDIQGTEGTECLNHLAFLDHLDELQTIETVKLPTKTKTKKVLHSQNT